LILVPRRASCFVSFLACKRASASRAGLSGLRRWVWLGQILKDGRGGPDVADAKTRVQFAGEHCHSPKIEGATI
jgi:predicted NAD/FAD-dependent oxidoreductase